MRKIFYSFLLSLLVLSCKTMPINQTASNLKHKEVEVTGSSSFALNAPLNFYYRDSELLFCPAPLTISPIPSISSTLQTRIGLTDNLEYQIRLDSLYYLIGDISLENSLKINLSNKKDSGFALLPYSGVYFNYFSQYGLINYFLGCGVTTGVKIIGDYKNKKDTFYYGIPLGVIINIQDFLDCGYKSYHIPSIQTGLSLGHQYSKKSFILRNEGFLTLTLKQYLYQTNKGDTDYSSYFIITLGHGISFGGVAKIK